MFGTIAKNLSFVGDEFAARIGGSINEKISEDLTFLKSKIKPRDSVLFLSNNTGLLAAVTGAQSVTCNSFAEIFFRKDYDAIVNLLKKDNSFTIVLDTVWLAKVKAEQGREEIIRLIENEYVCDYVTPNKRFLSIHHSANVIKSENQLSSMSNCFWSVIEDQGSVSTLWGKEELFQYQQSDEHLWVPRRSLFYTTGSKALVG